MKDWSKWVLGVPAVVLVGLLVAVYATRDTMQHLPNARRGASAGEIVDQSPWTTIVSLAPLAISAEEQGYVRDAARLADHEVDQTFAMALKEAALRSKVLNGEALELQQKVAGLTEAIQQDKAQVAQLTAAAEKAGDEATAGDDLDVAKAQLALDNDELTEATQDLARASGDQRGQIQAELTAHEAAMKKDGGKLTGDGEIAVISTKRYQTLRGRVAAWFAQEERAKLIAQAAQQARDEAKRLADEHSSLEQAEKSAAVPDMGHMSGVAKVKMLQTMSAERTVLGILDDRMEAEQQLAKVYDKWEKQVWLQHGIVGHLLLESFAWVAGIVLGTMAVSWGGQRLLEHVSTDRRRLHTLQTIYGLAVQLLGLGAVLLVVFGPPSQLSTVLGLATAGLTVVFQDFIIAFCGWFVLMGRNGIRVGDWVEINSVGGEVLEIGVFRTSLLETGNWTSRGHPTGRRVTFLNGFAIHGQYLNFSTSGQWMWDEITLSLAKGADYAAMIEQIRELVRKETSADVQLAEEEWQRVVRQNSLSQFSAEPTVDVRPGAAGVDLVLRYVTRAGDRFEVRNRIYVAMVELLHAAELPAEVK